MTIDCRRGRQPVHRSTISKNFLDMPGINYKERKPSAVGSSLYANRLGAQGGYRHRRARTRINPYFTLRQPRRPTISPRLLARCSLFQSALGLLPGSIGRDRMAIPSLITPKVLRTLPIPDPGEEGGWLGQSLAISRAVAARPSSARSNDQSDVVIDCLVAGLLKLDENDCAWVLSQLTDAQALEPIRTLRLANASSLRPITVE